MSSPAEMILDEKRAELDGAARELVTLELEGAVPWLRAIAWVRFRLAVNEFARMLGVELEGSET